MAVQHCDACGTRRGRGWDPFCGECGARFEEVRGRVPPGVASNGEKPKASKEERARAQKALSELLPAPEAPKTHVDPSPPCLACPYCAGDIPAGVKKCRHCGEWLDPKDRKKAQGVVLKKKRPFLSFGDICGVTMASGIAAIIAAAVGWDSLVVPAMIVVGTLGYIGRIAENVRENRENGL